MFERTTLTVLEVLVGAVLVWVSVKLFPTLVSIAQGYIKTSIFSEALVALILSAIIIKGTPKIIIRLFFGGGSGE